MIAAKRLENGNLLVPRRADTGEEGGPIGDALVEIGPDDPEYDAWLRAVERAEAREAET